MFLDWILSAQIKTYMTRHPRNKKKNMKWKKEIKDKKTPNSTMPKLWIVSRIHVPLVRQMKADWVSGSTNAAQTTQPVPGRCSKTLCWSLLVPHVRNASSMCRHATFNQDRTCRLHLQDNPSSTSPPPSCCLIFDPLLRLWSQKSALKWDDAPGPSFNIKFPPVSLLLMSSTPISIKWE